MMCLCLCLNTYVYEVDYFFFFGDNDLRSILIDLSYSIRMFALNFKLKTCMAMTIVKVIKICSVRFIF